MVCCTSNAKPSGSLHLTPSSPAYPEQMLGLGDNPEKLTNAEVIVLLDPSNPKVPYLYEGFEKWGTCTDWDPCPECVASPRAGDEDLPTGVSPFPRSPNQFSD